MIRLEVKGQDKFPKWIQHLPKVPEEAMQGAMRGAGDLLLYEARKNVTKGHAQGGLGRRTGNLYNNLKTRLELQGNTAEVRLTGPFYGRINARGAVITPKNGPYLVFKVGGRWVKSKRIVIPARPWDTDALKTVQRQFPSYFRKEVARLVGEMR